MGGPGERRAAPEDRAPPWPAGPMHGPPVADARLLAASPVAAPAATSATGTIGVAPREPGGMIVARLRTPSDGGMAGDAPARYPHHAAMARHIGPISEGISVFAKRFDA